MVGFGGGYLVSCLGSSVSSILTEVYCTPARGGFWDGQSDLGRLVGGVVSPVSVPVSKRTNRNEHRSEMLITQTGNPALASPTRPVPARVQ